MGRLAVGVLAVVACKYEPPKPSSTVFDAPVDQGLVLPDLPPEPDAPPGPILRAIEIVDGMVSGGPHTDFPLLVSVGAMTMKTTANGGRVENPNGFDIQFFDDAGATQVLAHEVEIYDGAAGRMIAWVKIPSLADATTFYIRYGDPALTTDPQNVPAVWTANYAAVYHLRDSSDSLGTSPGTNAGSTAADAQILGGRAFDGAGQHVTVTGTTEITNLFAGGGTVEAWTFADTPGQGNLGRAYEKGDVVRMGRCDNVTANSVFFSHDFTAGAGTWCSPANSAPLGAWVHMAVTYNRNSAGNVPTMYVNGVEVTVTNPDIGPAGAARSDGGSNMVIGDRVGGGRAFDGTVDELRFTKGIRDAGWLVTSYRNQLDPTAFISLQ